MAEPVTVKLRTPIRQGSVEITELTFRPVKARDLRRMQAGPEKPMLMVLELAGFLSGQPTTVIDELEGEDLTEILGVVGNFFESSQRTGTAPSES